jgi:hypothetical protein
MYLGGQEMGYHSFHSFLNSSFYVDSGTQIPPPIPTSNFPFLSLRKSS